MIIVLSLANPILVTESDKITESCMEIEKLPVFKVAIKYSTLSNKHPSNNL